MVAVQAIPDPYHLMRRLFSAASALAIALALPVAAQSFPLPKFSFGKQAPAAAASAPALKPGEWAQARSDVAPDPSIRFGALPNGMRYAIRKQSIPPGQAAIRMRVDAGSLMETDAQQGLAHFLEHMAFNGSKAVPEGEMIKILERLGLAFGADTNASTNFDETIYKLDLPRTNDETVDAALMLMRETAGNLTLDQGAIDRERGVVLSEERARDTPPYRVYKERLGFILKGQRPPTRYPIGKVEVLQNAQAKELADFYNRYYRPERTVLVVTGDFDVDAMEAKIKAKFGDWTAVGPAGTAPDLGKVQSRKAEAKLVVEPGAPLSMQVAWIRPPDLRPDTTAKRKQDLIEQLGFSVVNRRMQRLARGAEPPFLGAGVFKNNEQDAAEVMMAVVNAEPGRWSQALDAVEQEQRRAVQYGVRQDELDREIAEYRANLKADAAGAATRTPAQLAGEIVGSLGEREVVTNPAQDLALFEETVKDLKPEQVSAALKTAFQGDGPLLFVASPRPIEGGEGALLAALEASRKVAVAEPSAAAEVNWPYTSFGGAGKVVETKDAADLDATFVRFDNGVRLTVKPTRFKDDEILVRVNVGGGRLDLSKTGQNVNWQSGAYIEGGLKQISAEDMERVLASRLYGAQFGVSDDAFVFTGGTRPEDLDVQMQVLAAYVSEPGWRPEAFKRLQGARRTAHDQYEATDSGVLSRDLAALMHPDDQRWVFPSREQIAGAKLDDFKAVIAPALAAGDIEVVVVGDTTVEKAIDAVARTFGALPARPTVSATAGQREVGFPSANAAPLVLTHKGRADQSIGYIAWRTNDFFADPQKARDTAIMGEVLELRLVEELRESQGATYSPSVIYNHSMVWPRWGYVSASVEIPPAKLPDFFADVKKIAADLRDKDVSADELARAKKPRIDQIEKARETNGYWLSELSGAQADPRRLDATRGLIPGTERVSAADVRRAAQSVLRDDNMWMLEVRPASAK